jgi:hypothetical protein
MSRLENMVVLKAIASMDMDTISTKLKEVIKECGKME